MLQNYTSFGEMQTAPLEPLTIIVGANNSGKTNFLRFVHFMRTRGANNSFTGPLSGKGSPHRMDGTLLGTRSVGIHADTLPRDRASV